MFFRAGLGPVEKALVYQSVMDHSTSTQMIRARFSTTTHRCFAYFVPLLGAVLLSACANQPVNPNPVGKPPTNSPVPAKVASTPPSEKPPIAPFVPQIPGSPIGPANPSLALTPPSVLASALTIPREFRAAWVATVANIDWPSQKGLSAEAQRAEIAAIVNKAKQIGLNSLIVQVRPSADAIYPSSIEPWTEFLSGEQGRPPQWSNPNADNLAFDPLQTWVRLAHESGIALHAWFNPYRASHPSATSPFADNHVSRTNPNIVRTYDKYLWLDPGSPEAAQRTLAVIMDVVNRYDIDGVHIDDYFYPYPVKDIEFPDNAFWDAYRAKNPNALLADWRRQNVNQLVARIHTSIHEKKPWLQFGISPFGIGKPSLRPAQIKGFSQYDSLYADVELWLSKGWLDYLAPQLYWPIDQAPQAFSTLLDYWSSQNPAKRFIWPGLFTSKIDATPTSWMTAEIIDQIQIMREKQKVDALVNGHMHFSMAAIMQNRRGIADQLQLAYAGPAISPVTNIPTANVPSIKNTVLPVIALVGTSQMTVSIPNTAMIRLIAVWTKTAQGWRYSLRDVQNCPCTFNFDSDVLALAVATINRFNVQSSPVELIIEKK